MKEMAQLIDSYNGSEAERAAAQKAFLAKREAIWTNIREGRFPVSYVSSNKRKFGGAQKRTAIRCDFLLANKLALAGRYAKDRIADAAQRDLLFHVLRYRERFPGKKGKKFFCCGPCTSKVHEVVNANAFRYIDNAKWKAEIEEGGS